MSDVRALFGDNDKYHSDPEISHTLAAPCFYDPDFHEREKEKVFKRSWRYVGHQSEIAEAGDFMAATVAGENIFVIRGRDGEVRGFYNVCQHRASELVSGTGTVEGANICPYNSWTYDLEGDLKAAYRCERVKDFRKEDFSLKSIRVELFCGFVFVNLDADALSLNSQVGELGDMIRAECPGVETLKLANRTDYTVNCNWKVIVDNFIESYHLALSGPAHKAFTDLVASRDTDLKVTTYNMWSSHIAESGPFDNAAYSYNQPRELGGTNAFLSFHLFPDIGFLFFPGISALVVFVNQPSGPETTHQIFAYFTPDGSADEASEKGIHYFSHVLGPEDNSLCEGVQRGLRSAGYHQGRFMIDEQRSGLSEHAVHHFHGQILAAMTE